MCDRIEHSVGTGTQRDPLDHRGPIAEPVHLLPGQYEARRALQRARCQRRQHDLKLRPQPGAERAADEW